MSNIAVHFLVDSAKVKIIMQVRLREASAQPGYVWK